eukprot:scaffold4597_cov129-Skeletonema_dohrnii-CCMP3373.AAC.4
MPLRSLNRKKKKEQPQLKENKIKPCPSSPINLSSASSLTQTSSYSSCTTSSLASSTQTRKSAEPPGWVHNPPPRTLNEDISANNGLLKENNVPNNNNNNNNNNNHPPSNTPLRRQWTQQRTVPSPVCIRSSPQPPQSNTMPSSSYRRQNIMTHTMSENTIQMTYSESSGSEGSSISSLGLNAESNDEQLLDFERYECAEKIDRMTKSKDWTANNFDLCNGGYGGGGGGQQSLKNVPISTMSSKSVDIESQISFPQTHLREECTSVTMDSAEQRTEQVEEDDRFNPNSSLQTRYDATGDANSCRPEEISNCAAPTALVDMNRMQDIYGSMMVAFRKKIMAELREEMQKELQHQLFALKTELSEMNTRLANLEKNQASAPNLHQGLQQSSSAIEANILKEITSKVLNDKEQQQKQLEAMLDAKLAKAMAGVRVEMNLAVHEMKKEGDRLSKTTTVRAESPPHGKKSRNKVSWNCTSTKSKEEGLGCESALINASFVEAMQSIDVFIDDCDNLANEFDTIAFRMSRDGDSDDDSF